MHANNFKPQKRTFSISIPIISEVIKKGALKACAIFNFVFSAMETFSPLFDTWKLTSGSGKKIEFFLNVSFGRAVVAQKKLPLHVKRSRILPPRRRHIPKTRDLLEWIFRRAGKSFHCRHPFYNTLHREARNRNRKREKKRLNRGQVGRLFGELRTK